MITTTVVVYQKETNLVGTQTMVKQNASVLFEGPREVTLVATVEQEIPVPTGAVGVVLSNWDTIDDLQVGGFSGQYGPTLATYVGLPCVIPLITATSLFFYSAAGGKTVLRFV
jgi:hypothetical protein